MKKRHYSIFIKRTIIAAAAGLLITSALFFYPVQNNSPQSDKPPCLLKKESKTFPGYLSVGENKHFLKKCIDTLSNDEIPTQKRSKDSATIAFDLTPQITIQKQIKGGKISFLYSDINYISSRGKEYKSPQIFINDFSFPFFPDKGTCKSDYSYSIPKEVLRPGKNLFTINSGKYKNKIDTWAVENLTIEYYFSEPECID